MTGALRLALTLLVLGVFTIVAAAGPIGRDPPRLAARRRRSRGTGSASPARLIGMRVTVIGEPAKAPLLLAANHTSWLDITVLGGLLKPLSFVAKLEVAGWPILGTLARLQRTIFIDRTRRTPHRRRRPRRSAGASPMARSSSSSPKARPATATASCPSGARCSAPPSAAAGDGGRSTVQPVAISYVRHRTASRSAASDRPVIAWYGDMDFVAHFRRIISRRGGRRGGALRRADPVRAGERPQAGGRAMLRRRSGG